MTKQNRATICYECCSKLPSFICYLALGNEQSIQIDFVLSNYSSLLRVGTWHKDNWETYPIVQEIRSLNTPQKASLYNIKCPRCGSDAYQGLLNIECSANCKKG